MGREKVSGAYFIEEIIAGLDPSDFDPPLMEVEVDFVKEVFTQIPIDADWSKKIINKWVHDTATMTLFSQFIINIADFYKSTDSVDIQETKTRLTELIIRCLLDEIITGLESSGVSVLEDASLAICSEVGSVIKMPWDKKE